MAIKCEYCKKKLKSARSIPPHTRWCAKKPGNPAKKVVSPIALKRSAPKDELQLVWDHTDISRMAAKLRDKAVEHSEKAHRLKEMAKELETLFN